MGALEEQFRVAFEESGFQVNDGTLGEVVRLAFRKGIASASVLVDIYEAFCLNSNITDGVVSRDHLGAFERHMSEQKPPPGQKLDVSSPAILRTPAFKAPFSHKDSPSSGAFNTPISFSTPKAATPSSMPAPASNLTPGTSPFQQRSNRLKVVCAYTGAHTPGSANAQGKASNPPQTEPLRQTSGGHCDPGVKRGEQKQEVGAAGPVKESAPVDGKEDQEGEEKNSEERDSNDTSKPTEKLDGDSEMKDAEVKTDGSGDDLAGKPPEAESPSKSGEEEDLPKEGSGEADVEMAQEEEEVQTKNEVAVKEEEEDDGGFMIHRKRCTVEPFPQQQVPAGGKLLLDSLGSRWNEVNQRMERFIEAMEQADPKFDASKLSLQPSSVRETAVGRIICDSENGGGHLNDKSMLLEGCSKDKCMGFRVRLDLSNIPDFSLFPGQVVAVEGDNPGGHCLVASRLRTFAPPPLAPAPGSECPALKQGKRAKREQGAVSAKKPVAADAFTIVAAAGPFTASDNWLYEPLEDLLTYADAEGPDVLLLLGPFVDAEHQEAKLGLVDQPFEDIFKEKVLEMVKRHCQSPGSKMRRTQVVVQPSCRDAMVDWVYPQAPLGRDLIDEEDREDIVCLSNPSLFKCNSELTVGATTMDILRHLSIEETSRNGPGQKADRLSRLALHLLGQRSFYPLFPPAAGTCLNTALAPHALQIPVVPNVLFLPSDLAPFVKALNCTDEENAVEETKGPSTDSNNSDQKLKPICINPGRLTKGNHGGTFSWISIFSSQQNEFHECVKAEVIRI